MRSSTIGFGLLAFASLLVVAPASIEAMRADAPFGIECGLGKDFHMGRRAALREAVGEGVMVFRGMGDTRDYLAFRQDKTFWYLTGIESPNVVLVMNAKTGDEILYLPKHSSRGETWEGEKWDSSDDWVSGLTGFEDVRDASNLMGDLKVMLAGADSVWTSLAPHVELAGCRDRAQPDDRNVRRDPLDGRISREEALAAKLTEHFEVEVKDCTEYLDEMRRVKTAPEIAVMKRASEIGAAAMIEAIRSSKPGVTEDQLASLMTFVQRQAGATGPAYLPIVGAGHNANVLHYSAMTGVLEANELILLDYAPEVQHYTSDITRSWPVTGKFTPRMAELYDVVLAAQLAGIAAVKPGATIRDVNRACSKVIEEAGFSDLVLHGACHYIGMEVHDVGNFGATLEPGVAFTVEPGLYDREAGIGIRIEDVVVVTKDGCDVISKDVPKTRAEIEQLVGKKGLLDLR